MKIRFRLEVGKIKKLNLKIKWPILLHTRIVF